MSIATATARLRAQEEAMKRLDFTGADRAEAERLLESLRRMVEIEQAERRMWSRLVAVGRKPASAPAGALLPGRPA